MNLTKKQKIYGGLLILAAGGAFVDRVIIGSDVASPNHATASSTQSESAQADASDSSASGAIASFVPNPDRLITNRLAAVARRKGVGFVNVRDGFEPHKSWVGQPVSAVSDLKPAFTEADFRSQYPLMAVITTDEKSYAVVGKHTLAVGQRLHGFKLVAVKKHEAVFEFGGTSIQMEITSEP